MCVVDGLCSRRYSAKKELDKHLASAHRLFAEAHGVVVKIECPDCGTKHLSGNMARHRRTHGVQTEKNQPKKRRREGAK